MSHLESWMESDKWTDTWQPLPLHPSEHKEHDFKINGYSANSQDVASFKEKGYWISPKIIDDDTIKLLQDETKRVFEGEVDYSCGPYEYPSWIQTIRSHKLNEPVVRKINNAWYVNSVYRKLVTNYAIGSIASQLLDTDEVRLWHDQVTWKPSKTPGSGWHQDFNYWQVSNTSNMLSAFISLQDIDANSAGFRTIVGSHKWGLVKDANNYEDKDVDKLKERFASLSVASEDEPCIIKAGQIIFYHALTFHGSGPNATDSPNLSISIHLMPHGCAYAPGHGNHPNLQDLGPMARSGMLFEGDHFPLLFRKRRPSSNYDYP